MIYLDNNATTQPAPEVVTATLPYLTERWGNPSSQYPFGAGLGEDLGVARQAVASLIGAQKPSEIIFTSGGTESNQLAFRGLLKANPQKRHLITTAIEHSSILSLCRDLDQEGVRITYLPVDAQGQPSLADLEAAIRPDTALVSVMWANNETGLLSPLSKIAELCQAKAVPLHTDAVQAIGKVPVDVRGISLLSISAHKFHGPKGVGALYIRRGTAWASPIAGTQEHGRRAGTENVTGIVGMGVAAQLAKPLTHAEKMRELRDQMEATLLREIPGLKIVPGDRLPNTSLFLLPGVPSPLCLSFLAEAGFCLSTGSACSAIQGKPSHVLTAMGFKEFNPLRVSLSKFTRPDEIQQFCQALPPLIARLQNKK